MEATGDLAQGASLAVCSQQHQASQADKRKHVANTLSSIEIIIGAQMLFQGKQTGLLTVRYPALTHFSVILNLPKGARADASTDIGHRPTLPSSILARHPSKNNSNSSRTERTLPCLLFRPSYRAPVVRQRAVYFNARPVLPPVTIAFLP